MQRARSNYRSCTSSSCTSLNLDVALIVDSSFLTAVPTAELEPITENYVQADEVDMGMTYDELSVFGRLRKVEKCGPWSMFTKLVHEWGSFLSPQQVRLS